MTTHEVNAVEYLMAAGTISYAEWVGLSVEQRESFKAAARHLRDEFADMVADRVFSMLQDLGEGAQLTDMVSRAFGEEET